MPPRKGQATATRCFSFVNHRTNFAKKDKICHSHRTKFLVTSQGVVQVEKIMQQDKKIDKMMKPVPIMIAKLTELFLQRLIEKGGERALKEVTMLGFCCPMLRMRHLASVIRNDVRYIRSVHCVRS